MEIAALKRDVFLAREANDSANKAMKQDLDQLRVRSREQGGGAARCEGKVCFVGGASQGG